jgi:putative endonuclease
MPHDRQILGTAGEEAAEQFLRRQRYVILARNYRCRFGEVDLVALDGGTLVFIEVKSRRRGTLIGPFDVIDLRKQRQIARAAQHYVARHRLEDRVARFDVVGVWREGNEVACELLKDAFELPD